MTKMSGCLAHFLTEMIKRTRSNGQIIASNLETDSILVHHNYSPNTNSLVDSGCACAHKQIQTGGQNYDFALLNRDIIVTTKDHPVRMYGEFGMYKTSYILKDACDEILAPLSISVNTQLNQLFCGSFSRIDSFDLETSAQLSSFKTSLSRKSPDGLKGLVSSIDFNPENSLIAASSFSGQIAIYSTATSSLLSLTDTLDPGTSQVLFSACGNYIYSSSRSTMQIQCRDLRGDGSMPVYSIPRNALTQQRLYMSCGSTLVFGDIEGSVNIGGDIVLKVDGVVNSVSFLDSSEDRLVVSVGSRESLGASFVDVYNVSDLRNKVDGDGAVPYRLYESLPSTINGIC